MTNDPKPVRWAPEDEDRFWDKVHVCPYGGCWEWLGATSTNGYGSIGCDGKVLLAHRVSYTINCGTIEPGNHVMHTCDNKACVNPMHLVQGSRQDNMTDMVRKGRSKGATGETSPNAKLTEGRVLSVRTAVASGRTITSVANEHNVSVSCIWDVVHRKTWKHI